MNIQVQGTNDSSVVSKCSMVKHGYLRDDFIHKFVSKYTRRSPLIHRGYYIRGMAIDYMLRRFLKDFENHKTQVLSLGAGFDTSFFRLYSEGLLLNTVFYELDFPRVVARKANIIANDAELTHIVGVYTDADQELHSSRYHLTGVDLRDIHHVESLLQQHGFDFSVPTLILSECVLTYVPPASSDRIIQWCATNMSQPTFILYEQILPNDDFGRFMLKHFQRVGSPLLTIAAYPDLAQQRLRFLQLGWSAVEAMDMNEFYANHVTREEQSRLERLEAFDEMEGWHQKCSHYIVLRAVCAGVGANTCHQTQPDGDGDIAQPALNMTSLCAVASNQSQFIQRFAHSSVRVAQRVVTIGGFARHHDGKHGRSSVVMVTDLTTGHIIPAQCAKDVARMHHTCTVLGDESMVIIAGRHSPLKPCDTSLLCTLLDSHDRRYSNSSRGSDQLPSPDHPSLDAGCTLHVRELCTEGESFTPRWRHTAVLFTDSHGNESVIVYGGRTVQEIASSECWRLSINNLLWTRMRYHGEGPGKRQSHSSCVWRQWMVVCGGTDDQRIPQHTIHLLDLQAYGWRRLEVAGIAVPRYSHSVHMHRDTMILIGGLSHGPHPPPITTVHMLTGVASHYHLPTSADIVLYHGHETVPLDSSCLVVLGGGSNCFSFGTHFNQSPYYLDITPCLC